MFRRYKHTSPYYTQRSEKQIMKSIKLILLLSCIVSGCSWIQDLANPKDEQQQDQSSQDHTPQEQNESSQSNEPNPTNENPPVAEQSENPPQNKNENKKPPSEELTARQLWKKLDEYLTYCIHPFSERVSNSYRRYTNWVSESGPTGKEDHISHGLYSLNDPSKCLRAIEEANKMPPDLTDIHETAQAFAATLAELVPIVNEADDYYERKYYKIDDAAKGRELHPKLIRGFKAFDAASQALYQLVEQQQDNLIERKLKALEHGERNLVYLIHKTIFEAKQIVEIGAVPWQQIDEIDLDKLLVAIENYEKLVFEMETYATSHENEVSNFNKTSQLYLQAFMAGHKDFLVAAKELLIRRRDRQKFTTGEQIRLDSSFSTSVEGSPQKLMDIYNRLVNKFAYI